MTTLLIILLVALFLLGAPVFVVMAAFAFLGAAKIGGDIGSDTMSTFAAELQRIISMGTGEPAQILSTIPLFILAGYLMAASKTASRIVRFAQATLGWLPGGLAVVTILACALFTTFTGASGVTIVALGGLLVPALLKEGYPEKFSLGLIAGTGSVGLLFPPALPLFVYGTVYGVNDQLTGGGSGFTTDRFLFAGVMPGLLLVFLLSGIAVVVAIWRKVPRQAFDLGECGKSLVVALPEIVLPFLIIGALVTGSNIPEVASLTVVYVLIIEVFLYKDLEWRSLWSIVRESMALVGAIFIIIFAATALTDYFINDDIPTKLVAWISEHMESRWQFLLALNVFLLLVGMMMDIFSAIVIVVPLITPLAKQYGIDPYHLGVIFLLNLEIGYLTPPVGLNLFITSFKFQRPVLEVIKATIPFLVAMVVALGLVTYVPALTLVKAETPDLIAKVTLPDGTVKKHEQCKRELHEMQCNELFEAVTYCREEVDGEEGVACEEQAVADYVQVLREIREESQPPTDIDAGVAGDGNDAGVGEGDASAAGEDWGDPGAGMGDVDAGDADWGDTGAASGDAGAAAEPAATPDAAAADEDWGDTGESASDDGGEPGGSGPGHEKPATE